MEATAIEIISTYTRAQAIEDGQLVDVSETAREAGFRFPVAITAAVLAEIERGNGSQDCFREGRLWDVLWMASLAARRGGSRTGYVVKIGRRNHRLVLDCGPGDGAEPVITIGTPSDF